MDNKIIKNTTNVNELYEAQEKRRLTEAVLRPDHEKFKLFMKMLKIGIMLKNTEVTHKKITD